RAIDPAMEVERLDRDQRLIVVHAQDYVEPRPRFFVESRIGREGTFDVQALRFEHGDSWRDDGLLLGSHRPALAGVGIETGDAEPRRRNAEPRDKVGSCDARLADD